MKNIFILFVLLTGLGLSLNSFSNAEDGIKPLKEGVEATDSQKQVIRDGAKNACEDKEEEDAKEQCVADYYANHNLEEEPSCD